MFDTFPSVEVVGPDQLGVYLFSTSKSTVEDRDDGAMGEQKETRVHLDVLKYLNVLLHQIFIYLRVDKGATGI